MWVTLALMLISALVSYAMSSKPQAAKPLTLGEINIPTTEQGTPISVVFGDCWIADPMICWYGNLGTKKIYVKSGK